MRYAGSTAPFCASRSARALEFRIDFFFRFAMDLMWYIVQLAFFEVLFLQASHIAGWEHDAIRVFVGVMFVSDAIHMTVFANNMWWLPLFVNRGELDYYLVRPVSSMFMLSLREFAANSFMNLLIAIGILVTMMGRYPDPIAPTRILVFVAMLGVGNLIFYLLNLAFLIPVFWMHNGAGLREVWFGLGRWSERPDDIFTHGARRILLTVLPLGLVMSYPTRILIEDDPWPRVAHMLIVAALLTAFVIWFWRRGVRAYSSASS